MKEEFDLDREVERRILRNERCMARIHKDNMILRECLKMREELGMKRIKDRQLDLFEQHCMVV